MQRGHPRQREHCEQKDTEERTLGCSGKVWKNLFGESEGSYRAEIEK